MSILKDYPGAKTNSGIIQFMVNEIPYHKRYYELYAGSAQLYDKKKPAAYNMLADLNPAIVAALREKYTEPDILNVPALSVLSGTRFYQDDFIYIDPPYPAKARRNGAIIYGDYEMMGDEPHIQLLDTIKQCPAYVMISTSPNELYQLHLKDWRRREFETI